MVEVEIGVETLADARLLLDLVGGHRRPRVGGVADEVVVRARPLALVDGQRLQPRHHLELLAHVHGRIGRRGLARRERGRLGRPAALAALDAADEVAHLVVARVVDDHEIVVGELAHLDHAHALAVPAELVVQHHHLPEQRLQLGHRVGALDDVVVAVPRKVRVVQEQVIRPVARAREDLGHRGLDRLQLGARARLVAEHVDEHAEDLVLGALVPRRLQRAVTALDGRRHLTALPRLEDRQEDVVALPRHVAPARRPLLVHRQREAVDPEEVEREIAQEVVAPAVRARLQPRDDVGFRWRLLLEVAPDHRRELIERLEDGEVEVREKVGWEDHPPVPVDHKRLHDGNSSTATI